MDNLRVKVTVTGGPYTGASDEGYLNAISVGVLVPEGIISARTTEQAKSLQSSIREALRFADTVVIGSTAWQVTVRKLEPADRAAF